MKRCNLLLSVLLLHAVYLSRTQGHAHYYPPQQQQQQRTKLAEIAAKQSSVPPIHKRSLQLNETQVNDSTRQAGYCSLCNGFPLLETVVPSQPAHGGVDLAPATNWTCLDYSNFIDTLPLNYSDYSDCLFFRNYFFGQCCARSTPPYVCEQAVRSQVLLSSEYDASIMPLPSSGMFETTLLLEFHHITELSTKQGTVTLFVWIYLTWHDPRLAWTISDENCTTSFTARASLDMEKTEIWVPDIDLLNQASGVQTFPEAMATVYHDGTVTWKRNGGLQAFCFFTGLNQFPFDTLGCSFLIGSWTRDYNVHIAFGGANGEGWMAGEALDRVIYNEYTLLVDQTTSGYRSLPLTSAVYYNLYFERSSRHYVLKVLLPTIVFTILSFGVFFLDLRVGERLTYGLTVLLVIIAQDISTSTLLPITNQRLWINMFVVGSFYWVLVANLESVFVAWLYFVGMEHDEQRARLDAEEKQRKEGENMGDASSAAKETNGENGGGGRESISKGVPSCRPLHEDDQEQQDRSVEGASGSAEWDKAHGSSADHKTTVLFGSDLKENSIRGTVVGETEATSNNRRTRFARTKARDLSSRRFQSLRQLVFQKNLPSEKRHRTIKKLDTWFFWVLSSTYALFVILMFVTNSLWDDGNPLFEEGDNVASWSVL